MVQYIGKVVVVVAMTLHMDSSKGNDLQSEENQICGKLQAQSGQRPAEAFTLLQS